jgi:membrane protein required for beta-lactamase induction
VSAAALQLKLAKTQAVKVELLKVQGTSFVWDVTDLPFCYLHMGGLLCIECLDLHVVRLCRQAALAGLPAKVIRHWFSAKGDFELYLQRALSNVEYVGTLWSIDIDVLEGCNGRPL